MTVLRRRPSVFESGPMKMGIEGRRVLECLKLVSKDSRNFYDTGISTFNLAA